MPHPAHVQISSRDACLSPKLPHCFLIHIGLLISHIFPQGEAFPYFCEPSFDLSILLTKGLFVKISPRLEQLPGRYGCFSCTATPSISVAISGLYLTVAQSVSLINHCSPTENVQLGIASSEQPVGPIHEETAAQRSFPGYC